MTNQTAALKSKNFMTVTAADGSTSDMTTAAAIEGVCAPANFTTTVYTDANADGTQDNGELGLAGVTVNLLKGSGKPTGQTAVTSANGTVTFSGLTPGKYEVSVVAPANDGVTQHKKVSSPVTLTSGATATAVEGVYASASFTTTVYTDANADGTQDNGELGLAGVTVNLLKGNGKPTGQTAVTSANGTVTFSGLTPGKYEVSVVAPVDDGVTQHTNVSTPVTLTSGATAAAIEGVYAPANFTTTVYTDANADGTQDNGELGLAGVTVNLLNGSGASTGRTAVTNASGTVTFTGLALGSYEMSVVTPTGDTVTQATNLLTPVTLTSGMTATAAEGVYAPASFTTTVYTDANADSTQDNGELGLAGVTVNLLNGSGASTGRTAVTNASGTVTFTGLALGSYEMSVVPPTGDTVTQATNLLTPVTLASGATATAVEGVVPPPQTNFTTVVYLDANADGKQDNGELGLAGVTVNLLSGSGVPFGVTAITDSGGAATFKGLVPGSFEVAVAAPLGYSVTQEINVQTVVDLSSGEWASAIEGVNALGIVVQPPAVFTTTVYTDANGDRVEDDGEVGLAGVTVNLLNGSGAPTGQTAVTDASGIGTFTGLVPGTYEISVDTPKGDVPTQQTNVLTPVTLTPATTAIAIEGVRTQATVFTPNPPQAGANADAGLLTVSAPIVGPGTTILTVGAGEEFSTIAAAVNAAQNGDVIEVNAGTYTNDFATITANITMIGVGGMVNMVATEPPTNLKGILTIDNSVTIANFSFTGSGIDDADGGNGAGIRYEGGDMVLTDDSFQGNQDGLLAFPVLGLPSNTITLNNDLFNDNGSGSGYTHNAYIGAVDSLTVTNSVFENAQVGHELKSRALINTITNNVFVSGNGIGDGSYDIDLPNGGTDVLTNNTIIKGPNAQNNAMVHFGGEGIPYSGSSLVIQDNMFRTDNNSNAIGLLNQTSITADLTENMLDGLTVGAFVQGPATETNNFDISGTLLPNATLAGILPSSTLILSDSENHSVTLDGQIQAVEGGAGHLTLHVEAGHIIALGGSGGMDVTENATTGGNEYATAKGSTNALLLYGVGMSSIDSEGTDYIFAGSGNQSGQLNGTATVIGGAGTSTWSVNGTAAIDTTSGSTFMTLGAAGDLVITGTDDFFSLTTNGGNATWSTINSEVAVDGSMVGGAVQMQVYGGEAQITTAAGSAGSVIHIERGAANVFSHGADTLYGGAGDLSVIVSGMANVYAGTGTLSVYGRGDVGGANVYGKGGDYLISGDSGNITYHGGILASTVEAQLSNITLLGGAGLLTINGGSRDTLVGGSGGIIYNDFGGGANTVTTLAGSTNFLGISNSDQINSYGTDTIDQEFGNTSIDIYGNSSLTLKDGNSHIILAGEDSVQEVAGNDTFTVIQGAKASITTSDMTSISETGATVTVSFTDPTTPNIDPATVVVTGGAASMHTGQGSTLEVNTQGAAPVDIMTLTGNVAIISSGADRIHLGSGSDSITLLGSGAQVWAGSGDLTLSDDDWAGGNFAVSGGAGSVSLNLGDGKTSMQFIGGPGTASLTGGQLNIVGGAGALTVSNAQITSFQGGSGSANLSLDVRGSKIDFGDGNTTVQEQGWGASNVFEFLADQSGTDVISGFLVGTDKAILGPGVSIASQGVVGGCAQFLLSNGSQVTFVGIATTNGLFA